MSLEFINLILAVRRMRTVIRLAMAREDVLLHIANSRH